RGRRRGCRRGRSSWLYFFFKQKTAYEMRTDWSSDVCSSDLKENNQANINKFELPDELGILAIRNAVVFPGTVAPLAVGREKSKRSEERRVGKEGRRRWARKP